MTGPTCPRCGVPARGLRSSVHIWLVLGCGHWLDRAAARVLAEATARWDRTEAVGWLCIGVGGLVASVSFGAVAALYVWKDIL